MGIGFKKLKVRKQGYSSNSLDRDERGLGGVVDLLPRNWRL